MAFPTTLKQLCTPAYVYFIISVLAIAMSVVQNMGNSTKYSLGNFSCAVPSCMLIFVLKIVYIVFWTWVLNLMCKDGHTGVAWFLVLLPFVLLFAIISMVMMSQKKKGKRVLIEGVSNKPTVPILSK